MSTPNSLSKSDNLLIELFTEELPPKSLRRLGDAFSEGIYSTLKAAGVLAGPLIGLETCLELGAWSLLVLASCFNI